MFAHTDTQNKILGFYDSKIHTFIPEPFIEITEEQWQVALRNNHNKVNPDGTTELFDFRSEVEKAEQALAQLRTQRDAMLRELDRPMWLANLTAEQRAEIDIYYQALLDAPEVGELPAKPEFIK